MLTGGKKNTCDTTLNSTRGRCCRKAPAVTSWAFVNIICENMDEDGKGWFHPEVVYETSKVMKANTHWEETETRSLSTFVSWMWLNVTKVHFIRGPQTVITPLKVNNEVERWWSIWRQNVIWYCITLSGYRICSPEIHKLHNLQSCCCPMRLKEVLQDKVIKTSLITLFQHQHIKQNNYI